MYCYILNGICGWTDIGLRFIGLMLTTQQDDIR